MIYDPGNSKSKGKKTTRKKEQMLGVEQSKQEGRRRQTEAIIVTGERKQYVEILKNLKDKVDLASIGVDIKEVWKTREGDLLIAMDKGHPMVDTLKKEIERKCSEDGIAVRKGQGGQMTLHIKGLDAMITKAELERVLKQRTDSGGAGAAAQVKSLRPAFGGNQNATIIVDKNTGEILLGEQEIKVGWNWCKIVERFTPNRCYKCWEFGHIARFCKGTYRGNLCLNCAKEGHAAKDCSAESFCPLCKEEGHRADTMACPKYKYEVSKSREEREAARGKRKSQDRQEGSLVPDGRSVDCDIETNL